MRLLPLFYNLRRKSFAVYSLTVTVITIGTLPKTHFGCIVHQEKGRLMNIIISNHQFQLFQIF